MNNKIKTSLDDFLNVAIEHDASDLFLISGSYPALKVNGDIGVIKNHEKLESEKIESFLVKIMTKEEKKYFEEHLDIDFGYNYSDKNRFRVNAFVTKNGIGVSFRIIPSEIRPLENLGISDELKKIALLRSGLVLVSGSVGSGKTTTLASITDLINRTRRVHIVTIEDPIEYIHENKNSIISQREVGIHTKNFATGLRGALREAADVIMVGELRDSETMELAITAAETGCLVISTIHTRGVSNVADRIVSNFKTEKQNQIRTQIADSLKCVIWQRLIKSIDGKTRLPVTELMFQNYAISNMIRKGLSHQIHSVIETGGEDGMHTMEQNIKFLLQNNKISPEEAKKYIAT